MFVTPSNYILTASLLQVVFHPCLHSPIWSAHTRTYTRTYTRTQTRVHIQIQTHAHCHTHTHTHTHTHIHTYTYTHIHIHTHTHTHKHTHTACPAPRTGPRTCVPSAIPPTGSCSYLAYLTPTIARLRATTTVASSPCPSAHTI